MEVVPIPWNCIDGFFHAYWRRPWMYLDERIRCATSVWSRFGSEVEQRAIAFLRADLEARRWHLRNRELLTLHENDLGARLLITDADR